MACSLDTTKFLPVVEKLLALNPEKYRHFDEVARFVLGQRTSLVTENRMNALAHLAHVYDQLSAEEPERYVLGSGAAVLGVESQMSDPEAYLNTVELLVPGEVAAAARLGTEHVTDVLNALGDTILPSDVSEVLTKVDQYLRANADQLADPLARQAMAEQFFAALETKMIRVGSPLAAMLQELIDAGRAKYAVASEYINLTDVEDRLGLATYLASVGGYRSELTSQRQPDGTVQFVRNGDQQQVVNVAELDSPPLYSRPVGQGLENTGQNVFFSHELGSALVLRALNPADQEILNEKLQQLGPGLNAQITVTAMPLEAFTDERVARIQAGADTEGLEGLARRQHETFENAAQVARLEQGHQRVLTVRRPTKTEDGFSLLGALPDGTQFVLYSPKTYTMVASDNTTTALDLTNPHDQALVQELSVVRHRAGANAFTDAPLSAQDVQRLGQSVQLYDQFAKNVTARLAEIAHSGSRDVTDLFHQTYQFTASERSKTRTPLNEFVNRKGTGAAQQLTIVNVDAADTAFDGQGKVSTATQTQRLLPIVFYRHGEREFAPINVLGEGERVLHEGYLYTYEAYVSQVLGLDHATLVRDYIAPDALASTWALLAYFDPKDSRKPFKFRTVDQRRPLSQTADLVGFLSRLDALRTGHTTNQTWKEFGVNEFSFRMAEGAGVTLNFNAGQSQKRSDYQNITLELRGTDKSQLAESLDALRINFVLDQGRLNQVLAELKAPSRDATLIADLKSRFPVLANLSLDNPTQLTQFYTLATAQLVNRQDDLYQRLQALGDSQEATLGQLLYENVFAQFDQTIATELARQGKNSAYIADITNQLHQRFAKDGSVVDAAGVSKVHLMGVEYLPQAANAPASERVYVPKIQPGRNSSVPRRLDQYWVVNRTPAQTPNVVPASVAQSPTVREQAGAQSRATAVPETVAPTAVASVVVPVDPTVKNAAAASNRERINRLPRNSALSLEGGPIVAATPDEQYFQNTNLRRMLPQFGIGAEDVSKVLNLDEYDGHVSAAFLDQVIYLNQNLSQSGSVYHEGFHGVFRYLLDPPGRKALVDGITSDKRFKSKFTEEALREFARGRNQLFTTQTASLQAEEILADAFRDYILAGTKPTRSGWQKFFDLLKNLLRLGQYRAEQQRNSLFGAIDSGYYATATIQAGADLFKGKVALELITGIEEIIPDGYGGEKWNQVLMGVNEQQQLITKLVHDIITDTKGGSFDQRFEKARVNLYQNRYNVEAWITSDMSAERQARIRESLGRQYTNYQFVLGMAADGVEMDVLDRSPDQSYAGTPLEDTGATALESLKKLVKKEHDSFQIRDLFAQLAREESGVKTASASALSVLDGSATLETAEQQELREETPDSDFDKANNEHNRLDSLTGQMRALFGYVEYEELDVHTGLLMPRMVDGQNIFGILMKVTADAQPGDILGKVKRTYEQYLGDGGRYAQAGREVKAVYDKLRHLLGMEGESVTPTKNHQVYHQFVNVFHGTQRGYWKTSILTEERKDKEGGNSTWNTRIYLKDALLKQDLIQKKLTLTAGLLTRYNEYLGQQAGTDEGYEKALKIVQQWGLAIGKSSSIAPILSGNAQQRLHTITRELHTALMTMGFELPKSLVRLSLLAIDASENRAVPILPQNSPDQVHYDEHLDYVRKGQYIQKDLLRDLGTLATTMLTRAPAAQVNALVDSELADSKKKLSGPQKAANRYNAVVGKLSNYLVTYDPQDSQSTTKNGDGKAVYRYVSYTPSDTITQGIRQHAGGLAGHLSSDPFYKTYLRNYLLDNPLLGAAIRNDGSRASAEANLFFENFRIDTWGGQQQTLNGQVRDGVSYKNADTKGLMLDNLGQFLNRTVTQQKQNVRNPSTGKMESTTVEVVTYNRLLTQLEASGSAFLVTSKYRRHVDRQGQAVQYKGHALIVETLEATVQQEFNRMRREWLDREARATDRLENGINRIVNNYNGVWDANGQLDTSSRSLRAYQFNLLRDFFTKGHAMTQQLTTEALEKDLSFEQLMAGELGTRLRGFLDTYAEAQFQKHLDSLIEHDVLEATPTQDFALDPDFRLPIELDADDTTSLSATRPGFGEKRFLLNSLATQRTLDSKYIPEYVNEVDQTGTRSAASGSGNADFGSLSELYGSANKGVQYEALLRDSFFNFWENSLLVNQVFDGDLALGVKGAVDYFKRNKGLLAAGSTLKQGTHNVGMLRQLNVIVDTENLAAGQYDSFADFEQAVGDAFKRGDTLRAQELQASYERVYEKSQSSNPKISGSIYKEVADGQSYSLPMHQMDMHETLGRLGQGMVAGQPVDFRELLIAKTYRPLTEEETQVLEDGLVVHNSKKTVTYTGPQYHKLSEHLIDRNDVSHLRLQSRFGTENYPREVAQKHAELRELQWAIYNLRTERNQLHADALQQRHAQPDSSLVPGSTELLGQIQALVLQVHAYYDVRRGREQLHALLNAMEYHQIDQLMDTTASKKLTVLPVDVRDVDSATGYINLHLGQVATDNRFKYLQVETSGVHEDVKMGVQSKVLLPADMLQLSEEILTNPDKYSAEERTAAADLPFILQRYNTSLHDVTASKFDKLKRFLRQTEGEHKGDFDVADVFTMIRESLIAQGADSNKLKWFELTPDGQPAHGTNMPQVRRMLEFYFMSIYSNNVTDEIGSGFKNFHVSSYGYHLLFDRLTGEVIPQHKVDAFPAGYRDTRRYGTRYPGIVRETNAQTGRAEYFVEMIIPRPAFDNAAHEAWWMQHIAKMYATRIPTEDKRSMMAAKVVDFIDGSYRNTSVLPQLIHLLSGSDVDIDSIYGQKFASYRNWLHAKESTGTVYRKYGDYGQATPTEREVARFHEYLTHVSTIEAIALGVRAEQQRMADTGQSQLLSEPTRQVLAQLGYSPEEITNVERQASAAPTASEVDLLKGRASAIEQQLEEAFQGNQRDLYAAQGFTPEEVAFITTDLNYEVDLLVQDETVLRLAKQAYRKALTTFRLHGLAARIEATVRTLQDVSTLPVTREELQQVGVLDLVTPAHQNANLQSKLDLLSNAATYQNMYIRDQQNFGKFQDILDYLSLSTATMTTRYNPFTIDGVLGSRSSNATGKDGIMITANLNKFLAVSSAEQLVLHDGTQLVTLGDGSQVPGPSDVIWRVNGERHKKFGGWDAEGNRSLSTNGNVLGMFADYTKDPIPGALQMNEVNTATTLALMGLSLRPEFAVFLNFFPEVRSAVARVQTAAQVVSDTYESERLRLDSELGQVFKEEMFATNKVPNEAMVAALKELDEAGMLRKGQNSAFFFSVDPSTVNTRFELPKVPFDASSPRAMNSLLPGEMGYTVERYVANPTEGSEAPAPLSQLAQKIVLLDLYRQQAKQTNKLQDAARLVSLFKRLNPELASVDNIIRSVKELKGNHSIFQNSAKLFRKDSVWTVLDQMLDDLNEQSKMFLERTPAMAPLVGLLGPLYSDKAQLTADVVSFVGLTLWQQHYNADKDASNPLYAVDTANMRSFSEVETWVGLPATENASTLAQDLLFLRQKFPTMKLLSYYRLRETKQQDVEILGPDGELLPARGETYYEQMNKGKTGGEFAEGLIDDHVTLLRDPDDKVKLIARKLMLGEIFRTGLQDKPGSAIRSLDQTMLRGISVYVEGFAKAVQAAEGAPATLPQLLQGLFGVASMSGLHAVLDELLGHVSYAALKNSQKSRIHLVKKNAFDVSFNKSTQFDSALVKAAAGNNQAAKKADLALNLAFFFGQDTAAPKPAAESAKYLASRQPHDTITLQPQADRPELNQALLDTAADTLGIVFDEETGGYRFPFVFKLNAKQAYRLRSVDGLGVAQRALEAMSEEKDELTGLQPAAQLTGGQAQYELMPQGLGSDNVSPMGMSLAQAARYHRVVTGQEPLELKNTDIELANGELLEDYAQRDRSTTPVSVTPGRSKYTYQVSRDVSGRLRVLTSEGLEVAPGHAAYKSILATYKRVYLEDFRTGKEVEAQEDEQGDLLLRIARDSENPLQVVEAWHSTEPAELTLTDQLISTGLTSTTEASFRRWGDVNQLTSEIRKAYLSETGQPLDTQAAGMGQDDGLEVTPEDLIAFMVENPRGQQTVQPRPRLHEALADRFLELTGFPLDASFANRLLGIEANDGSASAALDMLAAGKRKAELAVAPKNDVVEVGRYVKYFDKGVSRDYVVIDQHPATGQWLLKDPRLSGAKSMRSVEASAKLVPTAVKGDVVFYSTKKFLVLPSGTVIPLEATSHQNWNLPENGDRQELLRTWDAVKNLDLTNERALRHFFQARTNTRPTTLEEFAERARQTVSSMLGQTRDGRSLTREDIKESLKCF